jgi:hypothetical protein
MQRAIGVGITERSAEDASRRCLAVIPERQRRQQVRTWGAHIRPQAQTGWWNPRDMSGHGRLGLAAGVVSSDRVRQRRSRLALGGAVAIADGRAIRRGRAGRFGGSARTSAGIGALLGPPLAGFLVDATRSYQVAILTAVGLALVTWLIAALVPARRVTSDARVRG